MEGYNLKKIIRKFLLSQIIPLDSFSRELSSDVWIAVIGHWTSLESSVKISVQLYNGNSHFNCNYYLLLRSIELYANGPESLTVMI